VLSAQAQYWESTYDDANWKTTRTFYSAAGTALGANWYDPASGQFFSPDPMGHDGSPNLYSFCGGDPVNHFDPDGRFGKAGLNYAYQNGIYGQEYRAAAQFFGNYASTTENPYLGAGADFLSSVASMGAANTTPAAYVNQAVSDYDAQGGGALGLLGAGNRYNPTKSAFDFGSGIDLVDAHELSGVERTSAGLNVFGATLLVGAGFVERPTVPQEAPPVIPAAETAGTPAEDFVTLYRQGNPETVYSSSRPVSTSLSSELTHYDPEAQLLQFKVPQSTFDQWRMQRLIETFNDLHAPSGIITPETRILPPASGQLNQFLVKPR